VTTPEFIDQTHELILEDCQISAKSIAEQMGISREQVCSIIHEDLDMRKLSAKWVPKCLNADQKRQRSGQILEFFGLDPNNFLSGARQKTSNSRTFRNSKQDLKILFWMLIHDCETHSSDMMVGSKSKNSKHFLSKPSIDPTITIIH
jgi:hypothetical protein